MQAPSKSRTVAVSAQEPSSVLAPTLVALVATVALLILLAPSVVRAQVKLLAPPASVAKTPDAKAPGHTVTSSAHGALAAQTADKSDAAAIDAPKALPRGPKARVVRSVATTTEAAAKTKSEPSTDVAITHRSAPEATESSDAGVMAFDEPVNTITNKIWGADLATQRGARGGEASTIFQGHAYDPVETEAAIVAELPPKIPRARNGEYASAPYPVNAGDLLRAGTVGRRAGSSAGSFRGIERLVLVDEVEVTLPVGVQAVVGARFVSVDADGLLKPMVSVVAPTGVFEIVKAENGRPTIARVIQQTGRIEEGQKLLPLEGRAVGSDVVAAAVTRLNNSPETEVVWLAGDALLPTVQSFLILGAGEREGVKAGDQFALVKRRGLGADAPEQRVALVRVVRVTDFGSTAIVIRQDQPGIAVGGAARLVARVP